MGARAAKGFETLVSGAYANPVTVINRIDKAHAEHAYDPLFSPYSLLEQDTREMRSAPPKSLKTR